MYNISDYKSQFSLDRRQKLDLRDEDGSETSLLDKENIREKLEQDGSVTFTSNGIFVQVTKDDDYVSNVSQDNENLPLDTRKLFIPCIWSYMFDMYGCNMSLDEDLDEYINGQT